MRKRHIQDAADGFVSIFRKSARESRRFMRLSQQEVASCMGTSQAVIARFESGKNKNPGIQFIFGLVRTLGMRLDFRIVLKNGRKVLS